MAYTTINKSTDYFNTLLYTGNGTAIGSGGNAQTGVGFQPDWVWIKDRSATNHHNLFDAVRGVTKGLQSSRDIAEFTNTESLTAFGTDGFTVGDAGGVNTNSNNYVAWNWKANGTGSANSDGATASTVSANATAGFSIVKYTGTGSGTTLGHGLGAIPKAYFIKNLASASWICYFEPLGATKFLQLDTSGAAGTASAAFNDTSPTSSVFSVGSDITSNANYNNYIAYVFAEKTGYSKFGSYTGNGNADGTFVYTGFKPAWVMVKNTDNNSRFWTIIDNKRNVFNPIDNWLYANENQAEYDASSFPVDFVSNGFKNKSTGSYFNTSGENYIYMAFAEAPLVGSNNIPATAR